MRRLSRKFIEEGIHNGSDEVEREALALRNMFGDDDVDDEMGGGGGVSAVHSSAVVLPDFNSLFFCFGYLPRPPIYNPYQRQ
jgi:hypothetical protein